MCTHVQVPDVNSSHLNSQPTGQYVAASNNLSLTVRTNALQLTSIHTYVHAHLNSQKATTQSSKYKLVCTHVIPAGSTRKAECVQYEKSVKLCGLYLISALVSK